MRGSINCTKFQEGKKSGLTFRDNKFTAHPDLPFGALALPAFDRLDTDTAVIDVANNHFVCECDKVAWLVAAMTHQFDRDALAQIGVKSRDGAGSLDFIQLVYDTSGSCLDCRLLSCTPGSTTFKEFARNTLVVQKDELKCSSSGQPLKSQIPGRKGNFVVPPPQADLISF